MERFRLAAVLGTLFVYTSLFQVHPGWATDAQSDGEHKQEGANTHDADATKDDKPVSTAKAPTKPMSVASKFRRIIKKAAQKQKSKGRKSDKKGEVVRESLTSAAKSYSSLELDRTLGKKDDTITATVGATTGSVALLFVAGAALKRQILGATPVPNSESHLPGALTDGSLIVSDSQSPEPYDAAVLSYAKPDSPRSILAEVAFPYEEAGTPTRLHAPIVFDGSSSPRWMTVGVAALLGLFSVAGLFWADKEIKRGGLLSEGLAAWDLDNCIMFVDVEGAHRFKRLDGEFLRRSAQVYLDAAQTTGLLRYLEKPRALSNVVSKIIRRTLTRTELFPVPRDKCFAALNVSTSLTESVAKTSKSVPTAGPGKDTETRERGRVTVKSAFMREVVNPTTGATAGILVHLERCPGWRRARERSSLLMSETEFLHQLKPSEGLGGCPRIARMLEKSHTIWTESSKSVKNNWMVATDVVGTPLIESITSESRLQILACNMKVMQSGALQLYFLVAASSGTGIKIHYALGSKQLLINLRGPPATDNTPCAINGESAGPVFENNIPVYAAFPIKNLRKALNKVSYEENTRLAAALKDLVLPFKTKTFGVVVEMLQENPATIPRKIALRKAGEVELKQILDGQ